MKKAYQSGYPVWICITQGNLHVERRAYINEEDHRSGVYYVKCNGLWFSTVELQRIGDKIDIYF